MISKSKLALIVVPACLIALAAQAATQRDNDVYFALNGVQSFSFTESQHSVHSKQPWGGISSNVSHPGSEAHILVKAGRQGSSAVAQWFKSKVGSGQTLVCDSKGSFPNELNFAAVGTLKFSAGGKSFTCDDVLIGQGHFATANNWWMGGSNMRGIHVSLSGATAQLCRVDGSNTPAAVTFAPQTPCTNHFNISTAP